MRISITGASGFVGVNLVPFLQKEHHIARLSMRTANWREQFDQGTDIIIHLAGKAHDTGNVVDTSEYYKVNRDLTIDLFDVFLQSEVRDFFYFSSVKAIADSVEGVLTEDFEAKPLTAYGISKFEAEKYILGQKLPEGKRVFVIRPCMIHGPGNKGNLNLLYKVVKKGVPWPLASYNNIRSFLSVNNLCFLLGAMINSASIPSGVYNFADDEAVSTNELIELMALSLGKKPKMWHVDKRVVEKISRIGDLANLPLNSERLKKLTENYVVSNSKIKEVLAIENLPYTVKEGILKTLFSFKSEN